MKGLIFGLGMIGEKHAAILKEKFGADLYTFRSSATSPSITKNLQSFEEAEQIFPDFVLISNATNKHLDTLQQSLKLNCPIFLEKPIDCSAEKLSDVIKMADKTKTPVYVAYCLRFNKTIRFAKDYLANNKPCNISIYNSNNLSLWPRKNQQSYSAKFSEGGGVVLDLSHEIDYLDFLSPIKRLVFSNATRNGSVTHDAPDMLVAAFETELCGANVNINYHGHYRERGFKIDFDDCTLVGDVRNNKIDFYKNFELVRTEKFNESFDEMYFDQWNYFFSNMKNPALMNNLAEARPVFELLCQMNVVC
jgi:predicted dehydrogenase